MMRSSGDERHKERLGTAAMLCMKALKRRSRPCWLVPWMRRGPPPGAIHLRIRCDGEIVYFKVGLQVSIGAVFEAFAERKRVGVEALRFRVEGSDSDVSDTVPTVGQLGFANLVLIDCFVHETEAEERRRMAAADVASRPMNAAVVVATPEELAAIAERRRPRGGAVEAGGARGGRRRGGARGGRRRGDQGRRRPPDDAADGRRARPRRRRAAGRVGLARLAADFAREEIDATNIKHVEAARSRGTHRARRRATIVAAARAAALRARLTACGARPLGGAVVRAHGRVPLFCNG